MIRAALSAVFALSLVAAVATTAPAASQVVAQKTSKTSAVYLTHALTPGHRYRIDVSVSGSTKYVGHAIENFAYVYKKQMGTTFRTLQVSGKGARSFAFTGIGGVKILSWTIAVDVALSSGRSVSVKIVDLGK